MRWSLPDNRPQISFEVQTYYDDSSERSSRKDAMRVLCGTGPCCMLRAAYAVRNTSELEIKQEKCVVCFELITHRPVSPHAAVQTIQSHEI